jgi:hypothetical protein
MTTTAEKSKDGKHYVLNGQKKWVTQGQWATHALCAARTGGPGPKGVSVFIIDLATKGITRTKMENSGVSSSGSTFVDLDEVLVPAENLLGQENKGFEIIMSSKQSANLRTQLPNYLLQPSHTSVSGSESQRSDSVEWPWRTATNTLSNAKHSENLSSKTK